MGNDLNIKTFLSHADLLNIGIIILKKEANNWLISSTNETVKNFDDIVIDKKSFLEEFLHNIGLTIDFLNQNKNYKCVSKFDSKKYKIELNHLEDDSFILKIEDILGFPEYSSNLSELSLFQTLLNYSPDAIYFKDKDARFIKSSKSLRELFKVEECELLGKTDLDFFEEEEARKKYNDDLSVIKTNKPIINKEEIDRIIKGKQRWVSSTKFPLFDGSGNTIGLFGISRDITDKKEAELKINKLNENFQKLITIGLGFQQTAKINNLFRITGNLLLDKFENIQLLFLYKTRSDEKFEVFSYPAVKTSNDAYRTLIEHILYNGLLNNQVFENGRATINLNDFFEGNTIRGFKDFEYRSASIYEFKEKHELFGYAFIFRNVEFEEHDIHFAKILFNKLTLTIARIHLIEELKQSIDKAEESDRLKSAFLNNISHEVRTPLNSVIGYSQLLKGKVEEENEQLKAYAEHVISNAKILLELIEDIIEISKIQSGKVSIIQQDTNINDLVDSLGNYLKEQLHRQGKTNVKTELIKQLKHEDALFQLDSSRVYQAIKALISNAVKFTEKGNIRIGYLVDSADIKFFVEDTGIGIPEKVSSIIFNLFRQGDETVTRKFGGIGVGLSIANALATHLGGKITFKTKLEEGSTFFFSIPVR